MLWATPDADTGKPVVDPEGDLAGILGLGQNAKNAARISADDVSQLKLVAGAGFVQALTVSLIRKAV